MAGAADPKGNEGKAPETAPVGTSGSPPEGYSVEEWAGLSETEREGIKDSIDNPEVGGEEDITAPEIDKEALKAIVAEGEKPPEKVVPDGAPVKPPAAVKPASEAAAPAPAAEGAVPEVPPAAAPIPGSAEEVVVVTDEDLLSYRPPESALAVKLPNVVPAEIKGKLDALDAKYDAGDIELREYNRERDELNREITETNLQARDELRANAVWTAEQAAFLAARPEYLDKGPDGKAFTERAEMLYGAFGKAVSRIGADPKYANAPGMKILIAADKAVRGAFGIPAPGKKAAAPAAAVAEDKGKPPATKPDVKTLADVPAAAANLTDDGFAAIDKLTGEAYEAALERMTQEQRDAYAARA